MPEPTDVLVIGGGPGGATAALLLAHAGFSVALLERKEFPRSKVCGEYLSATNLPLLRLLGLGDLFEKEAGPPIRRVGLFAGSSAITADLPRPTSEHGWGRALGRDRLDTLLLNQTAAAGVRVLQPFAAEGLRREGERYCCQARSLVTHRQVVLESPLVIAAHGSWETGDLPTQTLRRVPRDSDLFGFKAHFRGTQLPADLMPLLAFPGGYGGMVHSDAGRVSLSCCVRRDRLERRKNGSVSAGEAVFAHIMESCRGVRKSLDAAERDGPWLAAGPIRPGIRLMAAEGMFTVGNAAGEAHPVVAEGISMAMQGAWLLASFLIRWRRERGSTIPSAQFEVEYTRAWRRSFAGRIRAADLIAHWAMRPKLVALCLPVLHCFPFLLSWGARLSGKAAKVMSA